MNNKGLKRLLYIAALYNAIGHQITVVIVCTETRKAFCFAQPSVSAAVPSVAATKAL